MSIKVKWDLEKCSTGHRIYKITWILFLNILCLGVTERWNVAWKKDTLKS